jgi:adenylate cyclase
VDELELDRIRERLREAGASEDELAAAPGLEGLVALGGDLGVRPPGEPRSLRTVAGEAGIRPLDAQALVRAAGLPAEDLDAPVWFESDVAWLRTAEYARVQFGDAVVFALLRRVGATMNQVAIASSAAFRVNVTHGRGDMAPLEYIERNLEARTLIGGLTDALAQLLHHHLRRATRPNSPSVGRYGELRPMAIAFVDLVSSTALSESSSAERLAELIVAFESTVYDCAGRAGVRVVKTIGDEAMISGDDPDGVVRAALAIVEFCVAHPVFASARAGVAAGPVLDQDGDCYGPVVNRAARFVTAASDGTVMVDDAVAAGLGADLPTVPRAPVEHRGLGSLPWYAVTDGGGPSED